MPCSAWPDSQAPCFSVFSPYLISQAGLSGAQTSALLTIRGLASFLALFVVTQYTSKLGLRAGFLLEAVFVAAMAALLFALLRNRPADKGLPFSPAAW